MSRRDRTDTPRVKVLGFDEFNHRLLRETPPVRGVELQSLLTLDEVVEVNKGFSFIELLELAETQLEEQGRIDGIVNHWDFPGSCLHPLLCQRNGFPGPDPVAVARCEHKYWARRIMSESVPSLTPEVCLVDPSGAKPRNGITLDYSYWLKPVVGHSSFLGFRIEDDDDLRHALERMQQDIDWFGRPW